MTRASTMGNRQISLVLTFCGLIGCSPSPANNSATNPFKVMEAAVLAESSLARQMALVEDFTSTCPRTPFTYLSTASGDEAGAVFWYRQRPDLPQPILTGDAYRWSTDSRVAPRLTQLAGTDFFYHQATFEADARLDYKLVVNGDEWILDPHNPLQVMGGFGPNSELQMPGYAPPEEIGEAAAEYQGTIDTVTFASDVYGTDRTVWVYLPSGYDSAQRYAAFWFLDGQDFLGPGYARQVLDNTIASDRSAPLVAIFIPWVEREREYYQDNAEFRRYLIDELRPVIMERYPLSSKAQDNAVGGVSWSAQAALEIATHHPGLFGKAMCMSTAGRKPSWYPEVNQRLQLYFDWGSYEVAGRSIPMDTYGDYFSGQHDVWQRSFHDAHSWGNWRAHIDDVLAWFFPGPATD